MRRPSVFVFALSFTFLAVSAALATWGSRSHAVIVLIVGGMFIFPATMLVLRLMGRPALASKVAWRRIQQVCSVRCSAAASSDDTFVRCLHTISRHWPPTCLDVTCWEAYRRVQGDPWTTA